VAKIPIESSSYNNSTQYEGKFSKQCAPVNYGNNNSNTLELSEISILGSSMQVNFNQDTIINNRGFDFKNCQQASARDVQRTNLDLTAISSIDLQFDFTKQGNSNIMNSINKLYSEKKEDPLDKLLQQHISFNNENSFSQKDNMNNTQISYGKNLFKQVNQKNVNCLYGYNFF